MSTAEDRPEIPRTSRPECPHPSADGFDFPMDTKKRREFPDSFGNPDKESLRRMRQTGTQRGKAAAAISGTCPRHSKIRIVSSAVRKLQTPRRDRPTHIRKPDFPIFFQILPPVPRGCFQSLLRATCPSRIGRNRREERSPALHPWSIHSGNPFRQTTQREKQGSPVFSSGGTHAASLSKQPIPAFCSAGNCRVDVETSAQSRSSRHRQHPPSFTSNSVPDSMPFSATSSWPALFRFR